MTETSVEIPVRSRLDRLARRVRMRSWLGRLHRTSWLLIGLLGLILLCDGALGMPALRLRVALTIFLAVGAGLLLLDAGLSWFGRLDPVGLAHLLEMRYPVLAERLVTLMQLGDASSRFPEGEFERLLRAETEAQLAAIDVESACPLDRERRLWLWTALAGSLFLTTVFLVPGLSSSAQRLFGAWTVPLQPYGIEITGAPTHVLRGQTVAIEATIRMLDPNGEEPSACELVWEDHSGAETRLPMQWLASGRFKSEWKATRGQLRCRVETAHAASSTVNVTVVEVPELTAAKLAVTPPSYLRSTSPSVVSLLSVAGASIEILQYSKLNLELSLDRRAVSAQLKVRNVPARAGEAETCATLPVPWSDSANGTGKVELVADRCTAVQAELILVLEHELALNIPLGQWTVHADSAPRFVEPTRIQGGPAVLRTSEEYAIAANDALRLRSACEDAEGLGPLSIDFKINDGPAQTIALRAGSGRKTLSINDWLPLPSGIQVGDLVQFRIRVSDQRSLVKGEVLSHPAAPIPPVDLTPQVASDPPGPQDWYRLRVERLPGGFLKAQVELQDEEARGIIGKIRMKLEKEAQEVEQLRRSIHSQAALNPDQRRQAEKLNAFNREVVSDLLKAAQRFGAEPALSRLANHLLDIAENELEQSGKMLDRVRKAAQPIPESEKDLLSAHDAIVQAEKRLGKLADLSQKLAQDRLDQWELELLAKKQQDLAEKLQKLRAGEPLSDAELARQIEEIRQQQARLQQDTEQLPDKNKLVQESVAAMARKQFGKLADETEALKAKQKAMREFDRENSSAEQRDQLAQLTRRQTELANRAEPFAKAHEGPDVKPVREAANALAKTRVAEAITHQKSHEQRLDFWINALLPGAAVNQLRDDLVQLAKTQKAIRDDLQRLGQELPQLNDGAFRERYKDLLGRQQRLQDGIARRHRDPAAAALKPALQHAEQLATRAGELLAMRDALSSHAAMEKSQQQLETIGTGLPRSLPRDRTEIKDAVTRERFDQVGAFALEQKQIRVDTERLLADWMKTVAGTGKGAVAEKTEQLAKELMELAQKAFGPESKSMAKEAAQALESASKMMEASQAAMEKGEIDAAKALDDEASMKLEFSARRLRQLAQDQAMSKEPSDQASDKIARALDESRQQMDKAQRDLAAKPDTAQAAMKAAAGKLDEAAQRADAEARRRVPDMARTPATQSTPGIGAYEPAPLMHDLLRESVQGKTWGELPGELKTRMLQDLRSRFGPEHADLIQQYFERLAERPAQLRKE